MYLKYDFIVNFKRIGIMSKNCTLELKGHIIDSLTLSKIMDSVTELGATCEVEEIKVGSDKTEMSQAKITVSAENAELLEKAVELAQKHGAQKAK